MDETSGDQVPEHLRGIADEPAIFNMPARAKETFLETLRDSYEEHGDEEEALAAAWDALAVMYGDEGPEEDFEDVLPNP